jgi:hypothetical protein
MTPRSPLPLSLPDLTSKLGAGILVLEMIYWLLVDYAGHVRYRNKVADKSAITLAHQCCGANF